MRHVRYRWQDRRHREAGIQVNHVVDLDDNRELCDTVEGEAEIIQGLQGLGGDYYCVTCLRGLVSAGG